MKIGICGDVHFSQYSSIVRKRGKKYSARLENCIKSLNWCSELFDKQECDCVVYLGDFFDKPDLNAEEITALSDVRWPKSRLFFLVGNHEMLGSSFSSTSCFWLIPNAEVISSPEILYDSDTFCVVGLPYIFEEGRKSLFEYIEKSPVPTVVLSHNDIAGVQYGEFQSTFGFDIKEVEKCDFFVNGHIHNGGSVRENVINIGNLTGQNFNEDASVYPHNVMILDVNENGLSYTMHKNPYSMNFYKLDVSNDSSINFKKYNEDPSVLTIKCRESQKESVKKELESCSNIVESRIILVLDSQVYDNADKTELLRNTDYIQQFSSYVKENLGAYKSVLYELEEVFK